MNRKHIILFTTLGLIAILSLQTIWLYNTFILVRNNIYGETNNILDEALTEAIADFSKLGVPEGTTISSGPINDSIPANTYFYDGLWKLGIEVPLCEVDFFAFKLLKRAGLESEFLSCLADPKSGKIYQKSKVQTIPVWGVIKSDIIPIRTDLSQGIQLVLLNPYWAIFERMGLLMIATAIMMIMVITCIIYQIKIIIRQDKIAKVREDFSYAMIHDMKTPLSSILACTSFLHSGKMESMQLKELIEKKDFGRYALPNGEMPVCFLSTNDITGGNSGSPVLNENGELIGCAFDGNWESLSGDINFDNNLQRCINLDIRYVLFILEKLGGCGHLINEMTIVE